MYGLSYYPLEQGRFVVYEVDSIVYTQIPRDTVHYRYRIKEVLADAFIDNEGKTARRLMRYIKKFDPAVSYDQMSWTVKEVYMVNADDKKIQVQEGNVRTTKLIFPVSEQGSWNGNAPNSKPGQTYSYDYIDRSESIGSIHLPKVLRVKQLEFPTLISHQSQSEKYAMGVGLVYKQIIDVSSNNVVPGKPVMQRIESGLDYQQTLITFGHE